MPDDKAGGLGGMMTVSALGRAAHYRSEAEKFRVMAELEPNGELRASLLDLARQYDGLAASLDPAQT